MRRPELRERQRGAVSAAPHLDRIDRGIIEALQKNGREPFRRDRRRGRRRRGDVRARYQRLFEDDILQVIGVTNPLGLGFDAQAMVGINTSGAPEPVADEIARGTRRATSWSRRGTSTSSSSWSASTGGTCSS